MLLRFGYAKAANRTLILLLLTIAISLATDSLLSTRLFQQVPQLSVLLLPWDLVIGPLLLFYFQHILQAKSRVIYRVLHLSPALILFLTGAVFALTIPTEYWQSITTAENTNEAPHFDIALLLVQGHVAVYLLLCLREWLKYQACTRHFFSSLAGIELSWLRRILWIFGVMWLVWLLSNLFADRMAHYQLDFAFPFAVYFLGYSALIYRNVILPEQIPLINNAREQQEEATGKTAYERAQLSAERRATLQQALADTMQRDLVFLDPALNLASLASAIGASSHELSQLLNEVLNESFYDYINRLRTQEVQRCLKDPSYNAQTILEIALQSGFNSKAAFNATFKRLSGCTPSQYRKNQSIKFEQPLVEHL